MCKSRRAGTMSLVPFNSGREREGETYRERQGVESTKPPGLVA